MNRKLSTRSRLSVILTLSLAPWFVSAQIEPAYQITDRGPFYRNWSRTVLATDPATGAVQPEVQQYTELADGLCFLDSVSGQYADSQDLIELGQGAAVAQHGQIKAIFNANLNSPTAIDLLTRSGERFQSRPTALCYFDAASGQRVVLATIKDSTALLYPPNQVVWPDTFDGLRADYRFTYAKGCEADVILLERPRDPAFYGLGERTRLELWTEFFNAPVPKNVRVVTLKQETDPQLRQSMVEPDLTDQLLDFGDVWFPVGAAFSTGNRPTAQPGAPATVRVPLSSDPNIVLTGKRWTNLDQRTFLVESTDLQDLQTQLMALQTARNSATLPQQMPPAVKGSKTPEPNSTPPRVELAQAPYTAQGLILDYVTLNSATNSYTFTTGSTYLINGNVTIGPGTTTFQNNAVLKYSYNYYLMLSGNVSCPTSGAPVVFTSKDDNLYGQTITDSTGIPTNMASPAILVYYAPWPITIELARVRWARTAVQFEGGGYYHTLRSCKLEHSQSGVVNLNPNGYLTLTNDTYVNVTAPFYSYGNYSGSLTANADVVNVSHMLGNQAEVTVAINPVNLSNVAMFSVLTTGLGLFSAVTTNAGATWTTNIIANDITTNAIIPAAKSDPWASFDTFGNLFLTYVDYYDFTNAWVVLSTNGGSNFSKLTNFYAASGADRPHLATGSGGGTAFSSVWVCYVGFTDTFRTNSWIYASGAAVTNLGGIGQFSAPLILPSSSNGRQPSVAIGPTGQAVASFVSLSGNNTRIYVTANTNGLASTNWNAAVSVATNNLTWGQSIPAQTNRHLYEDAPLAFDLSNGNHQGRLYMVYTDYPSNGGTTNTDIMLRYSDNNGTTWTSTGNNGLVNNDAGTLSQFLPSMAVDPTSGNLAVAWYDCRNNPWNTNTQCFAAISRNGGTNFVSNFQVCPGPSKTIGLDVPLGSFDYGDFTGLAYRTGSMRFAWADNSNSTSDNPDWPDQHKMDIYTCTVKY